MGKHTRHGVPIDWCPDRARHRAEAPTPAPVYLDGRDIVATIARVDTTYAAARVALERASIEAEYRGLGIDPALIDLIESADTLAERTAHAKATGYRMHEGKAWATCSVEPYLEAIEADARRAADERPAARNADELTAIDASGRFTFRPPVREPYDAEYNDLDEAN